MQYSLTLMWLTRMREALSRIGGAPSAPPSEPSRPATARFRELSESHRAAFRASGFNQERPFFPQRLYFAPKAGPDALRLATWMCGIRDPDALWEMLLYASEPARAEFPAELFVDDDLVWHRQHLGRPGHVAYACVAIKGRALFGLNYVSDVVQRIARAREFKTRIENRFRAWPPLLLNGLLNVALERGITRVFSPTADLVLRHTDPARTVGHELFERVYDRAVEHHYRARRKGPWWMIDVAENRDRVIRPDVGHEPIAAEKTICVLHDIERGLGHTDVDPEFAVAANRHAPDALREMLHIERTLDVRATYNVVGCFLEEVRGPIERDGHCLAFHSFDHQLDTRQLARCRATDYRLEGYHPPRNRLTRELNERNLCRHNFQWLAATPDAIGTTAPRAEHRVVKVPVVFDDWGLYQGHTSYEEWERRALETVARSDFVAFGLHDCYAPHWLPFYREFLQRLQRLGRLRTLDAVAHEVLLAGCA